MLFIWILTVFVFQVLVNAQKESLYHNSLPPSFQNINMIVQIPNKIILNQNQQLILKFEGYEHFSNERVQATCQPQCNIEGNKFFFNGPLQSQQVLISFKSKQNSLKITKKEIFYTIFDQTEQKVVGTGKLLALLQKSQDPTKCQLNFVSGFNVNIQDKNFNINFTISKQISSSQLVVYFPKNSSHNYSLLQTSTLNCSIKVFNSILNVNCKLDKNINTIIIEIQQSIPESEISLNISGITIEGRNSPKAIKLETLKINKNQYYSKQNIFQSNCNISVQYDYWNVQFYQVQNFTLNINCYSSKYFNQSVPLKIQLPSTSSFDKNSTCNIVDYNISCKMQYQSNNNLVATIIFPDDIIKESSIKIYFTNITSPNYNSSTQYFYNCSFCSLAVKFKPTCQYPCKTCYTFYYNHCLSCYFQSEFKLYQNGYCVKKCSKGYFHSDPYRCSKCYTYGCNFNIIPFPFTIICFIILGICFISHVFKKQTITSIMIFSLNSIIQSVIILTLFILNIQYDFNYNIFIASCCTIAISFIFKFIQILGIIILKRNPDYQQWEKQNKKISLIFKILSLFSLRSFYFLFSKAFEIKKVSAPLKKLNQFRYLRNVLIISIIPTLSFMIQCFLILTVDQVAHVYISFLDPIFVLPIDYLLVSSVTLISLIVFLCKVNSLTEDTQKLIKVSEIENNSSQQSISKFQNNYHPVYYQPPPLFYPPQHLNNQYPPQNYHLALPPQYNQPQFIPPSYQQLPPQPQPQPQPQARPQNIAPPQPQPQNVNQKKQQQTIQYINGNPVIK